MPIHYGSIIAEVKHTRSNVSVFDICHMGEIIVTEKITDNSFNNILTVDVLNIKINKCKYGYLLKEDGGILDDLIVYRLNENKWMIVVNAGTAANDYEIIKSGLNKKAKIENISEQTAKLDLQGPQSLNIINKIFNGDFNSLEYFSFINHKYKNKQCIISRTGYTGELGYEIYIDVNQCKELWEEILSYEIVKPAGLGARDILRLEMGYPLYGSDIDRNITPLNVNKNNIIKKEADFIGKKALTEMQITDKVLIGFEMESRRAPKNHNKIFINDIEIGYVTSGCFSPHLNMGIGLGYIKKEYENIQNIHIDFGTSKEKAAIVKPPFLKNTSLKN